MEGQATTMTPSASSSSSKPLSPILKAGFLSKKGGERRNWNKRWFELRSHTLSYYNSRKANKLKGEIPLINSVIEEHQYESKSFVFIIKSSNRTYYISAFSEIDMKAWMKAILKCIQKLDLETKELAKANPSSLVAKKLSKSSEKISRSISPLSRSGKLRAESEKAKSSAIGSIVSNNNNNNNNNSNTPNSNNNNTLNSNTPSLPSSPNGGNSNSNNSNSNNSNNTGVSTSTTTTTTTTTTMNSDSPPVCITKIDLPSCFTNYSREQLIELINNLFIEQQKNTHELHSLKLKSAEVVSSMKSQLLSLYSENKTFRQEINQKEENIQKMQLKIVEANQRVVEATPLPDVSGRTRTHTLLKMMSETNTNTEPVNQSPSATL